MVKYIISALVAVALIFAIFFIFFSKRVSFPAGQKTGSNQVDTSDSSLDEDMTALEKDLLNLDETDAHFSDEIKSL